MSIIEIKLTHSFLLTCHDLPGLLIGCNKLSTFCSKLVKQSEQFPDRYDPLKYRGDGFELFVEALIKLFPADNRVIGIYDYQNTVTDEPGVDGFGKSTQSGKPATVQCKFVSNHDALLTANDGKSNLATFVSSSAVSYHVDMNDPNCMLVVTTAKGLHHYTSEKMFADKVRCLGWDHLRGLVDNNLAFWNAFRLLCS